MPKNKSLSLSFIFFKKKVSLAGSLGQVSDLAEHKRAQLKFKES
jgi:hypothetical protein